MPGSAEEMRFNVYRQIPPNSLMTTVDFGAGSQRGSVIVHPGSVLAWDSKAEVPLN